MIKTMVEIRAVESIITRDGDDLQKEILIGDELRGYWLCTAYWGLIGWLRMV